MGKIIKVSGPLVVADGMADATMADVVRVGPQQLIGEILNMTGDRASIQVYEETSGLGPGADVVTTGAPLSVELGPGLIENIYDGIQRPLEEIVRRVGSNITRGIQVPPLDRDRLWGFTPTPAVGDSVANILEEMGLETCGCCGTTACLALLNDAVKKGGVMASNHVGGLSGAFIPVSEDDGMIHAAECGCLTIEKLEAMTAVCSVGIDMVIIPGDTTPAVISALIADEAAIGMVNSKTTAVRVIPAIGRKAGEVLDFGGLLGYGPIMPVNQRDPSVFINRGGRLPAPMQSLKN